MTVDELKNLKVGDSIYYVPMSDEIEMRNPFLRTDIRRHSTYINPLGVFRTTITEIVKSESNHFAKNGWLFHCRIDTTPFKHLIREDKNYNNLSPDLHQFVDSYKPDFLYDNRIDCMFLNFYDADKFYKCKQKNFKRNVKTYISHLRNEIENATRLIEEAQTRINTYSPWSD